jgi:CBS-domain-containing membrane protein
MVEVGSIMTKKVVTVLPKTPLQEAILMLSKYDFNGLPVVDNNGRFLGMFSEQNMLADKSYVHLRTLLKLFSEMEYYKKDRSVIKDQLKDIVNLTVKDVMNPNAPVLHPNDALEDARQLFYTHANPLAVVDENNMLVGVLSMSDFTKFYGVPMERNLQEKDIDRDIDKFVEEFEKKFIIVSRFRAKTWLVSALIFMLVGFAIAMFFILRISQK